MTDPTRETETLHACPSCGSQAAGPATIGASEAPANPVSPRPRGAVTPPPPLPAGLRLVPDPVTQRDRISPAKPPAATAKAAQPGGKPAGKPARAGGPRQPIHVGIAFGVVAGVYAASLATVSTFQVGTNAQVTAAQSPALGAADQMKTAHDELDARVTDAENSFNAAVGDYQAVMDRIAANEARLGALSTKLRKIAGSTSKLSVPVPVPVFAASSGGGGTSRGGSSIKTIYVTRTVRTTSHACTTASGKPC